MYTFIALKLDPTLPYYDKFLINQLRPIKANYPFNLEQQKPETEKFEIWKVIPFK